MSSKLPWTRLNADKWLFTLCFLSPTEKCIYVMLRLLMFHTGEPISKDLRALALWVGYPVKEFAAALNSLIEGGHIICLDDGRLWNLEVEKELNNSNEELDNFTCNNNNEEREVKYVN